MGVWVLFLAPVDRVYCWTLYVVVGFAFKAQRKYMRYSGCRYMWHDDRGGSGLFGMELTAMAIVMKKHESEQAAFSCNIACINMH